MVRAEFTFWKLLVFLLVMIFILAAVSVFIYLRNIGLNELEEVVLKR